MKLRLAACVASLVATASIASAQQPLVRKIDSPATTLQTPQPAIQHSTAQHFTPPSLSAPPVTPELWIYSQEQQRHDDPAQAIRRKAELKADQRMARLASIKWYGYSNSRPDASLTPFMGVYSPTWIGNGWNRYDWAAASASSTVVRY
jgi:hypothetical protein